jgi:hypothetical protein
MLSFYFSILFIIDILFTMRPFYYSGADKSDVNHHHGVGFSIKNSFKKYKNVVAICMAYSKKIIILPDWNTNKHESDSDLCFHGKLAG